MSTWPRSDEYDTAIQNPHICFRDSDLNKASVEKSRLTRMPKVWTGNFAQVYELKSATKRWAVKCFTRSGSDIKVRYSELSGAIAAARLPYFVEFRFIDNEMLVNGKRYPVVKMEWVDGQSLEKHVEVNLFQPQVLLDTAGKLLSMVKDLEAHRIAHGDLQHGNIVITTSELKLVDYDGMFVPAFAGRPAAENGLPSYQHPRRGPSDFGVGLDRFALLVICTGLCALAVDPGLWYDFFTGDNFLFTSGDFKDPKSSKLFRRLSTIEDHGLRVLVDLLRRACFESPLLAPIPSAIPRQLRPRQVPWWVTSQTPTPPTKGSDAPAPRRSRIWEFRHVGGATVTVIGIVILALGIFVSVEAAVFAGLVGALAYVLERLQRYNSLPALVRRQELESKLAELRRNLQDAIDKKSVLEKQTLDLSQQESQEKAQELKRLQDAHISAFLAAVPISRLKSISGIGPAIIGNFQNAGIHNALLLKQRGPYVRGVGPKRRSQILGMLSQWERAARDGSPMALSPDVEARIAGKYQQQRQGLVQQIGDKSRRAAAISSEASQAEWQLKQLHVPTFTQFLKHSF